MNNTYTTRFDSVKHKNATRNDHTDHFRNRPKINKIILIKNIGYAASIRISTKTVN